MKNNSTQQAIQSLLFKKGIGHPAGVLLSQATQPSTVNLLTDQKLQHVVVDSYVVQGLSWILSWLHAGPRNCYKRCNTRFERVALAVADVYRLLRLAREAETVSAVFTYCRSHCQICTSAREDPKHVLCVAMVVSELLRSQRAGLHMHACMQARAQALHLVAKALTQQLAF